MLDLWNKFATDLSLVYKNNFVGVTLLIAYPPCLTNKLHASETKKKHTLLEKIQPYAEDEGNML
jgi:hypothetical protein